MSTENSMPIAAEAVSPPVHTQPACVHIDEFMGACMAGLETIKAETYIEKKGQFLPSRTSSPWLCAALDRLCDGLLGPVAPFTPAQRKSLEEIKTVETCDSTKLVRLFTLTSCHWSSDALGQLADLIRKAMFVSHSSILNMHTTLRNVIKAECPEKLAHLTYPRDLSDVKQQKLQRQLENKMRNPVLEECMLGKRMLSMYLCHQHDMTALARMVAAVRTGDSACLMGDDAAPLDIDFAPCV